MLTKALKTKHDQRVTAAQSFHWALWSRAQLDDDIATEQYQLAKYVCKKFAEYANVADEVLFSLTSENALSNWAMAISHPKSHDPALHRMRRDAKSLHRQLAAFETEQMDEINLTLGVALGAKLELGAGLGQAKLGEGADWSPKLRKTISRLIDGLDDVIGPSFLANRAGGALSEIVGYPGLAVLVFGLERAAQRARGKFTVHRKHGEKGTLIRALEELRSRLRLTDWGVDLADCLPSAGKHPITKYERIIKAARDTVLAG
jgi:hypothetical protein